MQRVKECEGWQAKIATLRSTVERLESEKIALGRVAEAERGRSRGQGEQWGMRETELLARQDVLEQRLGEAKEREGTWEEEREALCGRVEELEGRREEWEEMKEEEEGLRQEVEGAKGRQEEAEVRLKDEKEQSNWERGEWEREREGAGRERAGQDAAFTEERQRLHCEIAALKSRIASLEAGGGKNQAGGAVRMLLLLRGAQRARGVVREAFAAWRAISWEAGGGGQGGVVAALRGRVEALERERRR